MAGNLLSRYIWLVDTLRRAGRLTRDEINRRWLDSDIGNGAPLARRTFYNYRQAVYELFGIEIQYDASTAEYFIDRSDSETRRGDSTVTDWLLNSAAMSGMLGDARGIADRIFLEQVPSARHNLAPLISAIKESRPVVISYHPFTRSIPTEGIIFEPYLLKLFRQRWYVAGRNVGENKVKTYALDRITSIEIQGEEFVMSPTFNPQEYFRHSFGIVVDSSEPRRVVLRAEPRQAKYLRALPLHPSQQEMVNDGFSVFHYTLLLTPDLLTELMAMGPEVTVLAPPELRTMLTERLRATLDLYRRDDNILPDPCVK